MMNKTVLVIVLGICLVAAPAAAQQKTVTGKVTSEQGAPLAGVQILVKGTNTRTTSNGAGLYEVRAAPGQVLQFRFIGTALVERTVGDSDIIDVELKRAAVSLDAVVVTALGQAVEQRALGTAQQSIRGVEIAQTQRENFVNALQGRIAGVDVTSTSGVPGASASITIRGVSSISSSNQPLMIVDGLPMDNRTLNTGVLGSDVPGSTTAFNNRGVDFTNRAADLNPDDIETLTVLKGPAAAALYGIDAANGAIVISTKRGRAGGGWQYTNSFRIEATRAKPQLQRVYGPTTVAGTGIGSFQYFGNPYPAGTVFYDNIDGFLQTGFTQTHNLSFSGGSTDGRVTYRLGTSLDKQEGVVPNSSYGRVNVTGRSQAQVTPWLSTDLSMAYTYDNNDQVYKGDLGPLIGLMLWPQTDNAKDYLTPSGVRRRLTALAASAETDNPYFNVARNRVNAKNNRLMSNVGLTVAPVSWGFLQTNIGVDAYTNQNLILRSPESAASGTANGILDLADVIMRNINAQTVVTFNRHALTNRISIGGLVGHAIADYKTTTDAASGRNFLDPSFISMNNTDLTTRLPRTTLEQRRLVSLFGQAVLDYRNFLYLTLTGRNDWTSTIPVGRNSFFYPSVSTSFIFSDAFPAVGRFMTGKIRAAYAEVGKDARPYAFRPVLESKTTSYGGLGYGFTGPNLALRPEFAKSYEAGVELSFLQNRLGVDATVYHKVTQDQIVNDLRGPYPTGFILFNLNGATTRSHGLELTLRGTPLLKTGFSWDFEANFAASGTIVRSLPHGLPESYVSDTWLYGNVRNGTQPGLSTMSLTGQFYLRNKACKLLIDPTTGLPLRAAAADPFTNGGCGSQLGYDRQPDFTIGLTNTLRYKRFSLDFLLDIRKGGDVFNATEHYLTTRGLSMETLDRERPRVIAGVLRDGKENTANPTVNTIVVVPSVQTAFYTNMSEELFIQRDINWLRLRDVQVTYALPEGFLGARNASVFIKGTDLFLITNYTGMDPIVNGNSAAVGGSGGTGIDFGNFPMPRGFNVGIRMGF